MCKWKMIFLGGPDSRWGIMLQNFFEIWKCIMKSGLIKIIDRIFHNFST